MKFSLKRTISNNLSLFIKLFNMNRFLFVLRFFFAFLAAASTSAGIIFPKYLLNSILTGSIKDVIILSFAFGIGFLLVRILSAFYSRYETIEQEKINIRIINEFLATSLKLDFSFFDKTESFSMFNRTFGNCCNVINSSSQIILSTMTSILQLLFIATLLVWVDWVVFIVIFVSILISFVMNNALKKINFEYNKNISDKNKQINYIYRLFYIPRFVKELKCNNLSDFIMKKKNEFDNNIIKDVAIQSNMKMKYGLISDSKDTLENIFVNIYFGFSVLINKIAVVDYFTCINAYKQIKNSIATILSSYTALYNNSLYADDYFDLINSNETCTTNNHGLSIENNGIHKIEFVNVSFTYPNSNKPSLESISFVIKKGQKVAFVGQNGAGKTTIVKLLLRLYSPSHGDILINNKNISDYNTASLRASMLVLFQDFNIYPFSIKDNITLGKETDDTEIAEALDSVGLKERVLKLSQSINTPITSQIYKSGVELSGGEEQRLALAKMHIDKTGFIILDEPTSNLDPYAEYKMYSDLVSDSNKDKTCIIISHRLTLTYKMDRIFVINDGRIAEEGTHGDLLLKKGLYNSMYQIQAEKYVTNTTEEAV